MPKKVAAQLSDRSKTKIFKFNKGISKKSTAMSLCQRDLTG